LGIYGKENCGVGGGCFQNICDLFLKRKKKLKKTHKQEICDKESFSGKTFKLKYITIQNQVSIRNKRKKSNKHHHLVRFNHLIILKQSPKLWQEILNK
jgi:hypothetical protein